jgi:hypothetical protein
LGEAVARSVAAVESARGAARAQPGVPTGPAASTLVGAYREVLAQEQQKGVVQPEAVSWWRRFGRPLAAGLLLLIAAWLWLRPPAWLHPAPGPDVAWPAGPAGSQLLLINGADAIVLFREQTGRLPGSAELDTIAPGVRMQGQDDGGFRLEAEDGSVLVAPPRRGRSELVYDLVDPAATVAP